MKTIQKLLVFFFVFCCIFTIYGCNKSIGGVSVTPAKTQINSTIFDTKNLKIIPADIQGETNYSIKVIGHTTPLSDYDWNIWFGNEEPDIAGKLAVCLRMEYLDIFKQDKNATISFSYSSSDKNPETLNLTEYAKNLSDDNYLYLILNTKHDITTICINYEHQNKSKDLTYEIDLININSDSSRLE